MRLLKRNDGVRNEKSCVPILFGTANAWRRPVDWGRRCAAAVVARECQFGGGRWRDALREAMSRRRAGEEHGRRRQRAIHEFGHGLTCKHFRGECHEMGMMFLVLSPCLYCDVSDSWPLRNKWARIMIGAAGMYIEVVLSSLAVFGWWCLGIESRPDPFMPQTGKPSCWSTSATAMN